MHNIPFHLPLHANQDFSRASQSGSRNHGDFTLHSQAGESSSADLPAEFGTISGPRILTRAYKRSMDAAFGSPQPQEFASKRRRTGGANRKVTGKENRAVLPAPVSAPLASTPIRYQAPQASSAATKTNAGVPRMLTLLENALSQDDDVATGATRRFLLFPVESGINIANFIEGLKVLVLHASLRKHALPGFSANQIFRKGVSQIKCAAMSSVAHKRSGDSRKLMLSQVKKILFAPGTPGEFIELGEVYRQDKPVLNQARPKKHTCYYALKEMGVLTEIKNAIRRKDSPESKLSCQKRIEAMRLRMQETDVAEHEFLSRPENAMLGQAISPRSVLLAKLEAKQRITVDEVSKALSEYVGSPDQIRTFIRLVHACSMHLTVPAHQVDGFDAVALVRLAGILLLAQQQRCESAWGQEAAIRFNAEVTRYRLDASTPVEYLVAAQAAADPVAHPRVIDLSYAKATIENGINLLASIGAINAILSSATWLQDFGKASYEELLAECVLPPQADVMMLNSEEIVMAEIAPASAHFSLIENTTATTTTTRTITTDAFTNPIATPLAAVAVAQAEAAIPFIAPAGQIAVNGVHPAPQAQAPVARDARSLFSIERIVNKRS